MPTKVFVGLMRGQAQKFGLGYWTRDRQEQQQLMREHEGLSEEEIRYEQAILQQAKENLSNERTMPEWELSQRMNKELAMIARLREELFEKSRMMGSMMERMDRDHGKFIDYREFQHGLKRAGMTVTDVEAMTLLVRYDRNGDGRLEYNEFMRLLQNSKDIAVHAASVLSVADLHSERHPVSAPEDQLGHSALDKDLQRMNQHNTIGIGSQVQTDRGLRGIVRYAGQVGFSTGEWLGIELDQPQGKNDGSVQGQRYFSCTRDYGLFVRTITARPIYTPHGRSF